MKVKVSPNKPTQIIQCDSNKQDYNPEQYDLQTKQVTYFKMRDAYNNEVSNLDYHYLNVNLLGQKGNTQNFKISYQNVGMIKVRMNVRETG